MATDIVAKINATPDKRNCKREFAELFATLLVYGVFSSEQLRRELRISRPTLVRWASGQSRPHPLGIPPAMKWVEEQLTKTGN